MGVQGLWELLAPVGRRVSVETLAGKKIAIDASIWMVQFMKAMRDEKGEMVRNAHILGFFRRICKLLFLRTKPVFVFDGGTPALKRRTIAARRRHRENARAKIRKTAEKLLLNHLKAMKLEELAEAMKKSKQGADAKGKQVVVDDESNMAGSNSKEKPETVTGVTNQGDLDELLAASLAAEEDGKLTTNAPSSVADITEEEGSDDSNEEIIFPWINGNIDPTVLASLPPSMQLDLLVQMRERLMAENRQKYQKIKKVPAKFSELQIQSYLKTVAFRREIDEVQKYAAGRGVGGVQTSRIASEANREFIFSSSFTGDKQKLSTARAQKNGQTQTQIPEKGLMMDSVGETSSSQLKFISKASFDQQVNSSSDDVETCTDERGVVRASRAGELGFHMTRDLQRNLALMKEYELDSSKKSLPGDAELASRKDVISTSQPSTILSGKEIEISFSEDDYGKDDTVDDIFSHLVAESSSLNFSSENAPSDKLSNDSESDDVWEEGIIENVRSDEKSSNKESQLNHRGGMISEEGELLWEEGVCHVPVTNTPFQTENNRTVSKGTLEEEADMQEAIRRSTEDLINGKQGPSIERSSAVEQSEVNLSPVLRKSAPEQIQSAQALVSGDDQLDAVERQDIPQDLISPIYLSSAPGGNNDGPSPATKETNQRIQVSSNTGGDGKQLGNSCVVKIPDKECDVLLPQEIQCLDSLISVKDKVSFIKPSSESTEVSSYEYTKNSGDVSGQVLADTHQNESEALCLGRQIRHDNGNLENVSSAEEECSVVVMDNDIHPDRQLCPHDNLTQNQSGVGVEALQPTMVKTNQLDDLKEVPQATPTNENKLEVSMEVPEATLNQLDHLEITEVSKASLDEEMMHLQQERERIGDEQRKLEVSADSVSSEMFAECQELLQMFGLPYIIAPMEAEAQCAHLELVNLVDGVVTDDSDVFLFGAQCVYKNIFDDRKYVETYFMKDIENELGLTREKLIRMALLLGSDYTEGVSGIGIVNAIEVVNAFFEDDGLQKFREWLESPDPAILGKLRPHTGNSSKKRLSNVTKSDEDRSRSNSEFSFDENNLFKSDEQPSTNGVSEAKILFMNKHRNVSKNWHIPSSFPSESVVSAYTTPQVDESTEPFSWGKPDLLLLRKLCWERFGWSNQKADDLLVPVLKEYNKHETQLRLEAFYTFNERFAKIRSQRIKKAVKGITGKLSAELSGGPVEDDASQKRKSPHPRQSEIGGSNSETPKWLKRNKSQSMPSEEEHAGLHNENQSGRRGRGRGRVRRSARGRGRGSDRGRGSQKPSFESMDAESSDSGNATSLKEVTMTESTSILRRSARQQKRPKYTELDPEVDASRGSSDSSDGNDPDEAALGKEPVIDNSSIAGDICMHKGEKSNPSEEGMPMDYLLSGGGFCTDADDLNEDPIQTAASPDRSSAAPPVKITDSSGSNAKKSAAEQFPNEDQNLSKTQERSDVAEETSNLETEKSQAGLSAMPLLRRKRRRS